MLESLTPKDSPNKSKDNKLGQWGVIVISKRKRMGLESSILFLRGVWILRELKKTTSDVDNYHFSTLRSFGNCPPVRLSMHVPHTWWWHLPKRY